MEYVLVVILSFVVGQVVGEWRCHLKRIRQDHLWERNKKS